MNTLLPINVLPLKALDVRLSEMAKGFEEATIDKNTQEEKTINMDKQLETAARLRKVSVRLFYAGVEVKYNNLS